VDPRCFSALHMTGKAQSFQAAAPPAIMRATRALCFHCPPDGPPTQGQGQPEAPVGGRRTGCHHNQGPIDVDALRETAGPTDGPTALTSMPSRETSRFSEGSLDANWSDAPPSRSNSLPSNIALEPLGRLPDGAVRGEGPVFTLRRSLVWVVSAGCRAVTTARIPTTAGTRCVNTR
jgi:hypothetical protein